MANGVHCPQCGCDIELSTLMREQFAVELRASLQAEFEGKVANAAAAADARVHAMNEELAHARRKVASATASEAALLKKARELEAREQALCLDVEQRVFAEAKVIREQEAKAARERYAREAEQRVEAKEHELLEVRGKLALAAVNEAAFLKKERLLEERSRALTLDVERKVTEQAKAIRAEEASAAREKYAREAEAKAREQQELLAEAQGKLSQAAEREALGLRKQRELEERERNLAVDFERRMADEAKRIREQEGSRADQRAELEREQLRLRDEERRQQIDGLERTIDELQRKVRQGSQQTQGEAQEVILRDLLEGAFESDRIDDVPKGVNGADVYHRVCGVDGNECGAIVWESKRTKAWSDDWLPKLRDDQRTAGAACAVIVSQALPPSLRHFGMKDGVWISAWPYATALGAALRASLVEVALAKRVAEGRGEKMQMLYEYLTGVEFRNRVEGFVEAFKQMQDDLESEKRAMMTRWNKRSRLMQRARDNITAFYGDLQGIAGRQIQDLPALSLEPSTASRLPGAIAGGMLEDDDLLENDPIGAADPDHARLKELLFTLVPADGAAIGNGSLAERFFARALAELGLSANETDFARCRATLVAEGRLRKGKGRGGSVARVAQGAQAALEWSEPVAVARGSGAPAARQAGGN